VLDSLNHPLGAITTAPVCVRPGQRPIIQVLDLMNKLLHAFRCKGFRLV
jgi:hypothetical protein